MDDTRGKGRGGGGEEGEEEEEEEEEEACRMVYNIRLHPLGDLHADSTTVV